MCVFFNLAMAGLQSLSLTFQALKILSRLTVPNLAFHNVLLRQGREDIGYPVWGTTVIKGKCKYTIFRWIYDSDLH